MGQITVNGEMRAIADLHTIADLLATMKLDSQQVAIELNREIVPRASYGDTRLTSGDALEIVTFVGGG